MEVRALISQAWSRGLLETISKSVLPKEIGLEKGINYLERNGNGKFVQDEWTGDIQSHRTLSTLRFNTLYKETNQ